MSAKSLLDEQTWEVYSSDAHRIARVLNRDPRDAEDAAQSALVRLFELLAWSYPVRNERALLEVLVRRAGVTLARESACQAKHLHRLASFCPATDWRDHTEAFERQESCDALSRAIRELPFPLERVIVLSLQGHSGPAIAAKLGIAVSTVYYQRERAQQLLLERLAPAG